VPTRVKRKEYAIAVDRAGRMTAEGRTQVDLDEPWTPEHLVLSALAICSVTSLRFHARRANLDLIAAASASGTVTRREEDGRYAFVEVDCRVEVELDPVPPGDELTALLIKAERGCFVGASLTAKPSYRWVVNGREVE
jgi:organic hydroperoxide reductase OsmC/OhrA